MHTLLALLATALACALARPPMATEAPHPMLGLQRQRVPLPSQSEFLTAYIMPRFHLPPEAGFDDALHAPQTGHDLLNQEINLINQMHLQEIEPIPYEQYQHWLPQLPYGYLNHAISKTYEADRPLNPRHPNDDEPSPINVLDEKLKKSYTPKTLNRVKQTNGRDRKEFALTPLDSEYFEDVVSVSPKTTTHKADEHHENEAIEPRQTRQNPNWSKTKTLVSNDMDILRTGFTHDGGDGTDKPHLHLHVMAPTADPAESIYGVALLAAVGAALTMAIVGLAFGWYTLSRNAKAAADVDYPAYGVTGPTIDISGDRKLAQSAHMYHYQHQKQQIIAMERNGMDQRNGSVSDPESEEENEEGDYTVYECPGFATTGDMEVKNPLFKEDTTPASPKCDEGKPQHRE